MEPGLKEQFIHTFLRLKKIKMSFHEGIKIRPLEYMLLKAVCGCSPHENGENSCLNLSDMHDYLHITKPAVSQILNSLEKRKYIHRETDKEDRRKISIQITPEGKAAMDQAKKCMDDTLEMTIARFGKDNTKQLISLLSLLADVTEAIHHTAANKANTGGNQTDETCEVP